MKQALFAISFLFLAAPARAYTEAGFFFPAGVSTGAVQININGALDADGCFGYSTTTHRVILGCGGIQWPDGTVQIASPTAGGGVTVYPATATATFPYGLNVSTINFTGALDIKLGGLDSFYMDSLNMWLGYAGRPGAMVESFNAEGNTCVGIDSCASLLDNSATDENTVVGNSAGFAITEGASNAIFGAYAGLSLTSSGRNSFIGTRSGQSTTGSNNAFLGYRAGHGNTTGSQNTFLGTESGLSTNGFQNTTGSNNIFIGYRAGPDTSNVLNNASAIGYQATVKSSNTMVLGDANTSVVIASAVATPLGRFHNPYDSYLGSTVTIGNGDAGVNYVLRFNGETNDGSITWHDTNNRFQFDKGIFLPDDAVITFGQFGTIRSDSDLESLVMTGLVTVQNTLVIQPEDNIFPFSIAHTVTTNGGMVSAGINPTWNGTGTYTALRSFITDTASNAASLLMDFQVNTVSKWKVDKTGLLTAAVPIPIGSGGTGQTTATAAFDALAPTTTQGDIIYHDGTDNVRLAKGTAGQALKMNSGATAPEWASDTGYSISGLHSVYSPVDAQVVYWGCRFAASPITTAGLSRIYIPKAGTIKAAYVFIIVTGTLGTSETGTVAIRLNGTTDTTVSSSVTYTAQTQVFSNTGLSIAVAQGDYIEIKVTHPTWATNPTSVQHSAVLYIE